MPYKNSEDRKACYRKYYQRNKAKESARKKLYYKRNKDKVAARVKLYKKLNKDKVLRWQRGSRKFQRGHYLRKKLRLAVIHQKAFLSTIHKLIGCDVPTARAFLESKFEDWMSWENYGQGKGKWCIDHKDPIGNVDLDDEEEVKRVFHYTNMQPMEYCKNCQKGKK